MRRFAAFAGLTLPFLATGCPSQTPPPAPPPPVARADEEKPEPVVVRPSKSGLGFRISEAEYVPPPRTNRQVKGTPLSDDEVKRVLDRLPPLQAAEGDVQAFALRDKSQPPPKTGKVVKEAFPPPVQKPAPQVVAAGPLKVLRHLPDGPVDAAPNLSITFSQPMVPLTSLSDLSKSPPPVRLTPQPEGKWRWIGTQTVLFEPKGRFPMATDYEVEIPAGTRSQSGGELAKAESFKFTTPPPRLLDHRPGGSSVELEPLFALRFDQAMKADDVLEHTRVMAGLHRVPMRLATEDEIEGDDAARAVVRGAEKGRAFVLKAQDKLVPNTSYRVVLPEGTPSGEGPRHTEKAQGWGFSTYGPMVAERLRCSWYDDCPPLAPLRVEFSNPINEGVFDRSMVSIDPPVDDLKVSARGTVVTLTGRTKGRTTYKVTAKAPITDRFGQTLSAEKSFEIKVTQAEPVLFPEERRMAVVDPTGGAQLPVYSINRDALKVKLYSVSPADYQAYIKWRNDWDWEGKRREPPGKLVHSKVVQTKKAPDELVETPVDLGPALRDGVGQVLVLVEPTTPPPKGHRGESVRTWLQVTRLGIDALSEAEGTVAWVTALDSGAPVQGAEVSFAAGAAVATDADGFSNVSASGRSDQLIARRGGDLAMLVDDHNAFAVYRDPDSLSWFVFDDRKTYKPGEEARIKGYLRIQKTGKGEDLAALPPGDRSVDWVLRDARGVEIGKGSGVSVSAMGTFDFAIKLPKTPNLGHASLELSIKGATVPATAHTHHHDLSIEEFRRPEFEVTTSLSEGPYKVGRHAIATAAAKYYAGGGLAEAPVSWRVTSSTAHFSPPNQRGFIFGASPYASWFSRHGKSKEEKSRTETLSSNTNGQGEHRLRIDLDALEPSFAMSLAIDASVTDVNRQTWASHSTMLVHPGDYYVGLRPEKAFYRAGDTLKIDAIVSDIEGVLAQGKAFEVRVARLDYEDVKGQTKQVEKDAQTCQLTSAATPSLCAMPLKNGGRYKALAEVVDAHGRKSHTEHFFWVYGENMTPERGIDRGSVRIVPDREEYKPGDTAELLVMAPFAPAEGVITVQRQGLVHRARFTMKSAVEVVKVPIAEGSYPSVTAAAYVVGMAPREGADGDPDPKLPRRPAFAGGSQRLSVPPRDRVLKVSARPKEDEIEPGGATSVDIAVVDAKGAPVPSAEVAVVVADESVLALAGYKLPDPIAFHYHDRWAGVQSTELRRHVLLGKPDTSRMQATAKQKNKDGKSADSGVAYAKGAASPGRSVAKPSMRRAELDMSSPYQAPMAAPAPAAPPPPPSESPKAEKKRDASKEAAAAEESVDDKPTEPRGGEGGKKKPIAMRADFNPLAAFVPSAMTDASGHVTVPVKLPDNLTRYRVMAVAMAGEKSFGDGEGTITARKPLMVRPSAPRFLNFGDRFELPVVLQNQTKEPLEVDLAARVSNATLLEGAGRRVTVPPKDRIEVRLPSAALKPGTARFQLGAVSGRHDDAAQIELPVWTPATTEAFATYGTIDEGAVAQQVKMPDGVVKEWGGLEISTSSTAVSALTDAVIYLVKYPFECNEQISSRIIAVAALRDVLTAFASPHLPSRDVLVASVAQDINRLRGRQHWNGGWSFWGGDREPWPYLTVHVMHALSRAKEKGFDVPQGTIDSGKGYLARIEQYYPWYYPPEVRRVLSSYALYVRNRFGDRDVAKAQKIIAEAGSVEKLPLEALGWLLPVLSKRDEAKADVEAIRKHLANRVSETAGAAHFATSYSDGAHFLLHSDRKADGVLLEALIGDQPESDLIPKLVTGLLAHRKAGRWYNTQENAFVLLALDRYFNTYEKVTPDFVARAWLGDRFAGEHAYKGRTTDKHEIGVPMKTLAEVGEGALVLQKDGAGRMYYRVGMQYAPADLKPPPLEAGFTVTRSYEAVDSPDDVKRDADGTWRVKAGAMVRVRLGMVAPSRRYHVALVDPLPAGLEPMNAALKVTSTVPQDPKQERDASWFWHHAWYEHQNMRDERVEAFASLLWEGVYDYTYVTRATTPGTFVVPPPKAEEMYSPETFGRGAGDRLIVE